MAGGQGWLIGFVGVAFGMGGWESVVVGVDGWLLMMWVCLVVVGVAAVSRRGSGGVGGGCGWHGWGRWLSMVLDGSVPYFPVECIPVGLRYCVGECHVYVIWVCQDNATSVQQRGHPAR